MPRKIIKIIGSLLVGNQHFEFKIIFIDMYTD